MPRAVGGVLTTRQARIRLARRAMAAAGYQEAVTWSFTAQKVAALFGGGAERLVLDNPMAPDLDCMRPSALPGLIQAVGRNARRGFPGAALFEIGPIFAGDEPGDQRTVVAAVIQPSVARTWKAAADEDVFALKGDLFALLRDLGAPASLSVGQDQPAPLVATGPFGVAAPGKERPGDLRRAASRDLGGDGCRGSAAGVRGRPRPHTGTQARSGQDQAGAEAVALHASDPRLRLRGRQDRRRRRSRSAP